MKCSAWGHAYFLLTSYKKRFWSEGPWRPIHERILITNPSKQKVQVMFHFVVGRRRISLNEPAQQTQQRSTEGSCFLGGARCLASHKKQLVAWWYWRTSVLLTSSYFLSDETFEQVAPSAEELRGSGEALKKCRICLWFVSLCVFKIPISRPSSLSHLISVTGMPAAMCQGREWLYGLEGLHLLYAPCLSSRSVSVCVSEWKEFLMLLLLKTDVVKMQYVVAFSSLLLFFCLTGVFSWSLCKMSFLNQKSCVKLNFEFGLGRGHCFIIYLFNLYLTR